MVTKNLLEKNNKNEVTYHDASKICYDDNYKYHYIYDEYFLENEGNDEILYVDNFNNKEVVAITAKINSSVSLTKTTESTKLKERNNEILQN